MKFFRGTPYNNRVLLMIFLRDPPYDNREFLNDIFERLSEELS